MKSKRNFNETMLSEKLRKENPTEACGASLIKLMNSLYKRRLMILAFVLGNLLMVSTGYGYDVTISNNTSGGSWSALTDGTYTFTPIGTATINVSDITNRLTGNTIAAGNVTINTGAHVTTSDVIISTAITAANTTVMQRTFTINAAGSITVNTSSNINLYGSSANDGSNNTSRSGTNLLFVAGSTISIGSTINTSGGARGNADGGNAGSISLTAGTNSGVSINGSLIANGSNTPGNQNQNGGKAGSISIIAPGGISLSADITATGGLKAGTGTPGLPGTITINDGATGTTNNNGQTVGIISGGNFIKQGAGTFKLAGANTYTGTTTINEGTLEVSRLVVSGSASNLGNATSAIVLGSGTTKGTLTYTGAAATFIRGFTVNAGGGGITNASTNLLIISTGGITNGGELTLSNTNSGGTTISSEISSTGSLTINNTGNGVTTLSGANNYTGATTISAGTLSVSNTNNLGNATSAIVLGSASAKGTLTYTGTSAATFTRGFTVNAGGGGITNASANLLTISTSGISNGGELTLSNTNSGGTTISSEISSTGSLTINNTGNGVTTLSGANNYTGATTISAGKLELNNASALVNTTGITITNGSLDLKGNPATSGALSGSGTLTNTSTTVKSFTTGSSGANTTFSGTISGALNLTKIGAGSLTLSETNSYTGETTISEGTISISNFNNLGTATTPIVLGNTAMGTLSYTGAAADFTRGFTVNAGGGEFSGSLSSLSGAIALNGPLTLLNTGDTNLSGVLSYSGALTINNAGKTITLSGENTFTGATSISAGTLKLNNAAALGTSSGVTVENGTTLELNGFSTAVPLALNGGTLSNSSTAASYNGAITLGAASTIAATGDITLGGGINGLFSLTKTGAKILNTGTVPSEISALTISVGNLTIPAGGQVTVAGETAINVANGLTIVSETEVGGAGTGSFITGTTTGTGTASIIRYMSPRRWHIVSSPVSGQTVGDFLEANGNIPKNTASGAPTTEPFERGMRGYDPENNQWGNFFTAGSTESMTNGKGYLVRVKSTGDQNVTFTGTPNSGDISVTGLASGLWNCIGNPYTSAIAIKSGSGSSANFLDVNATDNLDPLYGAVYLWHQTDAEAISPGVYYESEGSYQTISNASFSFGDNPSLENDVQQGQAFMVKMASTATTLNFTQAMQLHNTSLALKSTNNIWPTIKLSATADSITSSTIIAFHEGMTPGLDPTYDAGLLKGGASVEVYTRLVEDNGIPFDIQALPADYQSTVVPVGIDCTKGRQVCFSAELMHLPAACKVLLEDRLTATFTDLAVGSYTTDLMGSTVSQDRFFLHTSYSTTGMDSRDRIQNLRAWAVNSREMKISGPVSSEAIATLYDLQGRTVAVQSLQGGTLNSVPLKGLKQGVYLLRVQDASRSQVLKVSVGK